jgi:gas vesicle protein
MSERGSGFGGFLLGMVVGAVVGLLFAPEAGEGTRHKLSRRLRDLRDAAEEKADEVRGLLEAEGETEEEESPRSTREELERRLQAARRRRRRPPGTEVAAGDEEEDEPVA